LKLTDVLSSVTGSGIVAADAVWEARFVPKMDTNEPGTTGAVKVAASTTPPAATTGV
jgi:hypothetical protein